MCLSLAVYERRGIPEGEIQGTSKNTSLDPQLDINITFCNYRIQLVHPIPHFIPSDSRAIRNSPDFDHSTNFPAFCFRPTTSTS